MKIPNTKTVMETAVVLKTSVRRVLKMIESGELSAINISTGKVRPRWAIPNAAIDALANPKPAAAKRKIPRHV